MNLKTILLTGATGYLGHHITRALWQSQQYHLILLAQNRQEQFAISNSPLITCYYLNQTPLQDIFDRHSIDIIIHTATLYGRNCENAYAIAKSNILFPLEILSLAQQHKVQAFINTDTILKRNTNAYSLSKKQFLEWLDNATAQIKVINLCLDHFYGPNDKPTKFVAWLVQQFKQNVLYIDLTNGTQTRDFIYVDDVVDAYQCVLTHLDKFPLGKRHQFEVGTGNLVSIKTLVLTLKEYMGNTTTHLNFGAVPTRQHEMDGHFIDISALQKLGWRPQFDIYKGLKELLKKEKYDK